MYQVLYRKWRPKTFADVVGQPHVTETLKNELITGRVAHAYLFTGSRGTGKTTCAKIFAKAVNCLHPIDGNPCGECEICCGIEDESIMDVTEMDAASNRKIEDIRDLLEEIRYTPAQAKYQAMEGLIHNLNTMHSRAGAQVPFSSINYGTDTSPEGRMVMRNLLLATDAGLGNGETPIFPVQIFKVKEGINFNKEDPNYDLFRLSCKVSAKRLFPNFSFLDAPFNLQYYKPGDYNTEVAYMGCRTRVMGNVHDRSREITCGRGNLSFTTINLPRIGIEAKGDWNLFYSMLDSRIDLVFKQLLHRFKIQCSKKVRNYPFLMGQGVWIDSDDLGIDDSIAEVLKHGTLSVGFIGLAETLKAMTGQHHGESEESYQLGLDIIKYMRGRMDKKSAETGLNFTLLATCKGRCCNTSAPRTTTLWSRRLSRREEPT